MLTSIQNALILDARGQPTDAHLALRSRDWDEIGAMTDSVYMPYVVNPDNKLRKPRSEQYAFDIGSFTLSRFCYGVPVDLRDFAPDPGKGIALTTVRGCVRHCELAETAAGESFLVDNSRTGYFLAASADHLQVNLSFSHRFLADLYERWHGRPAPQEMWQLKFKFGGPGSSWYALLEYASRCIAEMPEQVRQGPFSKHLEEILGMNLLSQWRQALGDQAFERAGSLAPRFVKQAEDHLREHAREVPTLTEVAAAVGVSVRALTHGFRSFRGHSPGEYLRELRLQGVRADLLAARPGATVSSVVAGWGYVNMGIFAHAYERRFGELPSQTLRRLRD